DRLVLVCELEVERELRGARLPVVPLPQCELAYDTVTVRGTDPSPVFHELVITRRPWCMIPAGRLARSIERRYALARAAPDRVVRAADRRPAVEVWLVRRLRRNLTAAPPGGLQWFTPADVIARVGSPVLRDPTTLSALAVAARSELVPEWSAAPLAPVQPTAPTGGTTDESSRLTLSELRVPALPRRALDAARQAPDQFVNALLSTL